VQAQIRPTRSKLYLNEIASIQHPSAVDRSARGAQSRSTAYPEVTPALARRSDGRVVAQGRLRARRSRRPMSSTCQACPTRLPRSTEVPRACR
jgi:hypothetical protein